MKKICASVFLLLLCVLFCGTLCGGYVSSLLQVADGYGGGLRGLILTALDRQALSERLDSSIAFHDGWIHLFGASLRATGVDVLREDNGNVIVRFASDRLSFIDTKVKTFSSAQLESIHALREKVQASGARCWFVLIPQKTCSMQTRYAARGIKNYEGETDALRKETFVQAGYRVLDLHTRMHAEGLDHESLYFRTDHHWKGETALWAAGEVAAAIGLDQAPLDVSGYEIQAHPKCFLGSEGKHLGMLYCGMDDCPIPVPRFTTRFTRQTNDESPVTGDFSQALLFEERFRYDPLEANQYAAYLDGDRAIVRIRNHNLPEGRRVLLIKDSFSFSMAPYLALVCGETDLVDTRHYDGSVMQLVQDGKYDDVLVTMSTRANSQYFEFH